MILEPLSTLSQAIEVVGGFLLVTSLSIYGLAASEEVDFRAF